MTACIIFHLSREATLCHIQGCWRSIWNQASIEKVRDMDNSALSAIHKKLSNLRFHRLCVSSSHMIDMWDTIPLNITNAMGILPM